MRYRKDIQVLRGISVLLVVLFHLEIGGIESGFLGVDIFLVISGFLMAILYDKNVKVKDFFFKRARRLLPAYFITILATLVVAFFITTPNEFNSVVEQSVFATFLASNIGFWNGNSYFYKAAFQPLLHLWSLGLEIQFYLLVPFLFRAFSKRKVAFPICLLLSLVACFYMIGISTKTAFFMTPLRLWEFLIGYGVAKYLTKDGAVKNASSSSWLGGAALTVILGIPFMKVDGVALNFISGHPGIFALIVSLATGTVLAFGIPKVIEKSKLGTVLEIFGKYSYSVYLVHFPVIVLYLYQPFSGTNLKPSSLAQTFVLLGITLILSMLMYHFVENPARFGKKTNNKKVNNKKTNQWWLALPCIVLILSLIGSNLQQLKFAENELLIFNAWNDRSTYRCGKLFRVVEPKSISCEITKNLENPDHRIMLVGNSHADAIKTTFSSVADELNVSVRFMVENIPLMPTGMKPKKVLHEALSRKADTIVLHYSPGAINLPAIKELIDLAKNNEIEVAFIMPVPVWNQHIPQALWNSAKFSEELPVQTLEDYERANQDLYQELSSFDSANFRIYQLGDILCQENCSILSSSGKPFYFDEGHLTLTGSEKLITLFHKIINDSSQLAAAKDNQL